MTGDKIKILVVIPNLSIGGAERLTVYLLKRINRKKFDVALCLFEKKGELLKELPEDIEVYTVQKKSRWSFIRLIANLKNVVAGYEPDILYSRMWYATAVTTLSRKLYAYNVPVVATEEHNFKRDISAFDPFGMFKKYLLDWSYKKSDVIIVPSQGVKKDVAESYKLKSEKVKIIYNSVDLDLIHARTDSLRDSIPGCLFHDNSPVIVAFGRLVSRKGFSDLLNAFRLVRSQMSSHLVFIGDGEERLKLEKLALDLDLREDVKFLGFLENPFQCISTSDIFVLSSHWEGFGNVIIEAMACGVPVISTDCPFGPDEIITDGVNGLLVPVADVEAMAQAILRLLQDTSLRKDLAEAGRLRAEDFRVEKMVAACEKVFAEVLRE